MRRQVEVAAIFLATALAATGASLVLPSAGAQAAVRVCGAPILGQMTRATTERAARRGAITSWRKKASRLGRPFTSWRLAMRKRYQCARLNDGQFVCVAFAVPCRIVQRPPSGRRRPPTVRPPPIPGHKARPHAGSERRI